MDYFDFENKLNILFPQNNSLDGDKVGLQIKNNKSEVTKVLITLEITEDVILESNYLEVDTIISFHPLIYKDFSLIDNDERVGKLIKEIIKSNLNVFIIHTNFDTFEYGTNYILAKKLNLNVIDYLVPLRKNKLGDTELGMGLICESFRLENQERKEYSEFKDVFENSVDRKFVDNKTNKENKFNLINLLEKLDEVTNSPIKYCVGESLNVNKIAIVCGSGSSFIDNIFDYNKNINSINNSKNSSNSLNKIDTFITADITYHTFHKCKGKLNLIDIGHFEMEQFVVGGLFENITKFFKKDQELSLNSNYVNSNFENHKTEKNILGEVVFYKSKILTNPVEYYQQKNLKNYKENQLNYLLNH